MNTQPSVVVNKKSGFFAALAKGFFGLLIVGVICGTVLGVQGMRMAENQINRAVADGPKLLSDVLVGLQGWQAVAPPMLVETLSDRRELEYRTQIDLSHKIVQRNDGEVAVVVELVNNGDRAITLLPLRILLVEADGVPTTEYSTYAATPILAECDGDNWNGPLLPGGQRRTVTRSFGHVDDADEISATVEIVDIRVALTADEIETQRDLARARLAEARQAQRVRQVQDPLPGREAEVSHAGAFEHEDEYGHDEHGHEGHEHVHAGGE
jgi:xanthine/CO dehydrogenase XdhC/CoxF family maturation factor